MSESNYIKLNSFLVKQLYLKELTVTLDWTYSYPADIVDQINSYDGGLYLIETRRLICRPNQSIGFYMRGTSVIKKLMQMLKASFARTDKGSFLSYILSPVT